jgi:hypothetical protein
VNDIRFSQKGLVIAVATVSLFGMALPTNSALANSHVSRQAQETGPKSPATQTERSGSAKDLARRPLKKPDGSGNFVYQLINYIRTQSEELCARYGNPSDCLEEAEVCLTMRDNDDNNVRLCLNTTPGDSEDDEAKMQKSRLKR